MRIAIVWSFEHADILFFQGLLDWIAIFLLPYLFEKIPFAKSVEITDLSEFTPKWLIQVETDTYYSLCGVLNKYHKLLESDFGNIFNAVEVLKNIIKKHDPEFHIFLDSYQGLYLTTTKSFICPFTRSFCMPQLYLLFDSLLCSDMFTLHFYFAAGIFFEHRHDIMNVDDITEVMEVVQDLPTMKWTVERMKVFIQNAIIDYQNDKKDHFELFEPMEGKTVEAVYKKTSMSQLTSKQIPILNDISYTLFQYSVILLLFRIFISMVVVIVVVLVKAKLKQNQQK